MKIITSFSGEFGFLSNFHHCRVEYEKVIYPTSEHAYQAAKTLDPYVRFVISSCRTPGSAKRMGQTVPLRPMWDEIRLHVMEDVLRSKFENFDLRAMLCETENWKLIEGNTWNDTYWGVCNGQGSNHLGKLLMKLRHEYQGG